MIFKGNYLNKMHLVKFSPWPFSMSIGVYLFFFGNVLYWHKLFSFNLSWAGLLMILTISFLWWFDVNYENIQGFHKFLMNWTIQLSMILFMLSEILFFFSFFWAYFHNCLSPSMEVGYLWPPIDYSKIMVDPFSMPLLNTVVLLSSGALITMSHYSILNKLRNLGLYSLLGTLILGVFFLYLQLSEYKYSLISIKSKIYGSMFFLLTGFHGFHVCVGSVFLLVSLLRYNNMKYSSLCHISFELCAWYWHFVDVVWLFLYIFIYWYGFLLL